MKRKLTLSAFLTALITICTVCVHAEDLSAALAGKVVDQNSASVAGARVVATRVGTGITSETTTDTNGAFSFELVRGTYRLTVSASGFEIYSEEIRIISSGLQSQSIVLQISPATATVTVSDDAIYSAAEIRSATKTFTPLLDVPQAVTVIKREQITDQMLSSIADVVRYVPGVSSHQGEGNRDDLVIRGNRTNADFFRDGVRDDVQHFRDLYNLERVEALKGPNAMVFGRGGGGGVINRVTKEAGSLPVRGFTVTGGSFAHRRFTGDIGHTLGGRAAFRLNGVYENSGSFREYVGLTRTGINPTFTLTPDLKTSIRLGYEFFRDRRTADRGITSFQGLPVDMPISTFYGDPDQSRVRANVNHFTASVERLFGGLIFRNYSSRGLYNRGYQNFVPGIVNSSATLVSISAYNNSTTRANLFNQTDLTYSLNTGRIKHTLVGGSEFGRQVTDNLRNTGYFNNLSTSIQVPFVDPVTRVPVTFRQSATDADNHLRLNLGAAFVQDQIEFSRYFQAIAGVRYDYFDLTYRNNRNGQTLGRIDRFISPRLGLVIKPVAPVSLYGSYSVSYLPSSGDQFSSLTTVSQQVKPEKFLNYEAGVKWDIRSDLNLTTGFYRLDRTNTRATDPNDPSRIVQTGSQRTTGVEVSLSGNLLPRWTTTGGYTFQNARITSDTTAAPAGSQVALVPHQMFSLWNKFQVTRRLSTGVGLSYRSDMFAAIDNSVVLPSYLKVDAAIFYILGEHWRLQANLENLTDRRYFATANNNTNISPGAPRSVKIGLVARF